MNAGAYSSPLILLPSIPPWDSSAAPLENRCCP